MLKKISYALVIALGMQSVCLADMNMNISAGSNEPIAGDTVEVSFDISENEGFNNYTFFVDYDADFFEPSVSDNSALISADELQAQMNVVPSADDEDFDGLGADGKKTAAQLGRIKLAGLVGDDGLGTAAGDLSVLKLNFTIKGNIGESGQISVVPVNTGFAGLPVSGGSSAIDVVYNPLTLTVKSPATFVVDENGVLIGCDGATAELEIPSEVDGTEVTAIGDEFLKDNTEVESVVIPDGISEIGSSAFSGCTSLKTVVLPESVVSFGDYAFENCTSLTEIDIPENLNKMGVYVFKGCTKLKSLNLR